MGEATIEATDAQRQRREQELSGVLEVRESSPSSLDRVYSELALGLEASDLLSRVQGPTKGGGQGLRWAESGDLPCGTGVVAVSSVACASDIHAPDDGQSLFPAPTRLQPVATLMPPLVVAVKRGRGRPRKQPLVVPPLDGAVGNQQEVNGMVGAKVPKRGRGTAVANGGRSELVPLLSSLVHTTEAPPNRILEPVMSQVDRGTHPEVSGAASGANREKYDDEPRGGSSPEVPLQNESRGGLASLEPAAGHSSGAAVKHPKRCFVSVCGVCEKGVCIAQMGEKCVESD